MLKIWSNIPCYSCCRPDNDRRRYLTCLDTSRVAHRLTEAPGLASRKMAVKREAADFLFT